MTPQFPAPPATAPSDRRLWGGYAGMAFACLLLYALAATDWQRGTRTVWDGLYGALWNLGPPALLGPMVLPWTRRAQSRQASGLARLGWHALGALAFVAAWLGVDWASASWLFGRAHAQASFEQGFAWRSAWGVFTYGALVVGFGGALNARRAQAAALQAAQAELRTAHAQHALVRAELANIQGKLNPHFLFNTLNTLLMLARKDSAAAEEGLLTFARLMRYVLDSTREAEPRVPLRDELAFVRDYLDLEQLRLGERLRVQWDIEPAAEQEVLPPLTLQPLVENAIQHGIAPCVKGGTLTIQARRAGEHLRLRVADDGPGTAWPLPAGARRGVGLAALQRRFELDHQGQARFKVQTAPGAGFAVDLSIPLE